MREEVEEKRMIPGNQTSFRKDLGTSDNIIYVINYLMGIDSWRRREGAWWRYL